MIGFQVGPAVRFIGIWLVSQTELLARYTIGIKLSLRSRHCRLISFELKTVRVSGKQQTVVSPASWLAKIEGRFFSPSAMATSHCANHS